ncbi:MAG: FAD-binding protein [bacterium]|nr:FAD-binding protein [bacterium]
MSPLQIENLRRRLLAPESLVTGPEIHEDYAHDATDHTGTPECLLIAETTDDVVAALKFCHRERIPVTPRGTGTGLSGGCVASPGALLLSTEKLKSIEIDPTLKVAFCGPGDITKELQDAALAHGLAYPPDPASYEECSMGGNIAENAGGLRCKRFGVTRDYVIGLEAVLMDGSLIRTGVLNKNRGFSLGDVIVGSEGTLAVVTRIAVRLIDQPGPGDTILVAFKRQRDAAQTVTDITRAGIIPSVMEFLDGDAAACANEYEKTEGLDEAAALLLLETSDIDRELQTERIKQICEKNDCSYLRTESDAERADNLWKVRRNMTYAAKDQAELRISEDVAVPNSQFPLLVEFVSELNRRSGLRINSYGHAGDGNLHVNFMAPKDTPEAREETERHIRTLMQKTIELGGTLSGEHGIGLAKRPYLSLEFDSHTLRAMHNVKSVFDPNNLLNSDKIFPTEK